MPGLKIPLFREKEKREVDCFCFCSHFSTTTMLDPPMYLFCHAFFLSFIFFLSKLFRVSVWCFLSIGHCDFNVFILRD